jgi:hypothetical protein
MGRFFARKSELAAAKLVADHYRELWNRSLDRHMEEAAKLCEVSMDNLRLRGQLTQEQIKNGKLRKAIHDARDVMEKAAPVEEGK